ncbi:MAG: hypothetical protein EXR92_07860 [Gemmatimonadetes bacterium]|nr:hypothetical protein [Gemmatimonadota bacterium]
MEWIRIASNPWGDQVLIGLAWDVAWLVVVLGALFIVGHAALAKKKGAREEPKYPPSVVAAIPAQVTRHGKSARYSHWVLAAATFALLITAFVPMLGLQFPWITIHWIAGIVLAAYVVYHTIDTIARMSWGSMWVSIGDSIVRTKNFFARTEDSSRRPGKWGMENVVFHHLTAVAGVAVVATGILMMSRVDTWFWSADPYRWAITDANWGLIFVIHGVASVSFIGLIMAHLYFAVRPDKFWITKSMFRGWITKEEYLEHCNPERWPVGSEAQGQGQMGGARTAGAGASGSSRMDRARD